LVSACIQAGASPATRRVAGRGRAAKMRMSAPANARKEDLLVGRSGARFEDDLLFITGFHPPERSCAHVG